MKTEQRMWTAGKKWSSPKTTLKEAGLVLIFGETSALKTKGLFEEIKQSYPEAYLFGCSTSGEIYEDRVYDDTVITTAVQFEKTQLRAASLGLNSIEQSFEAGFELAEKLEHEGLKHVLVFSVGLGVNGSELVRGLVKALPLGVGVTGGLAGDQDRFQETLVIADAPPSSNTVAVIGLYGNEIQVGSASLGGWDMFGPERLVTKASGNVLYELDGKSALQVYKTYLGAQSADLPGSGLLFPLCVRAPHEQQGLVRTILSIDESNQSLTFAGDVPVGSYARLMKANFDRLIGGAIDAAEESFAPGESPELALLISCVGRKMVLKQRTDEEVEGVRDIFGSKTILTGFYSYGEISPFTPTAKCELHNQTMTITTFSEYAKKVA